MSLLVALLVVGRVTGVTTNLTTETIRNAVQSAGAWGYALYLLAFVLGELVQVPGFMFIAAATLVYGPFLGFPLALVGSVTSVAVGFLMVRWVGGQLFAEVKQRHVKTLLSKLDQHPVLVVFALRALFWVSPPITYALALTRVRFRDYLLGSAVGLLLPVLGLTFFFEWAIRFVE